MEKSVSEDPAGNDITLWQKQSSFGVKTTGFSVSRNEWSENRKQVLSCDDKETEAGKEVMYCR